VKAYYNGEDLDDYKINIKGEKKLLSKNSNISFLKKIMKFINKEWDNAIQRISN